MIVRKSDVFNRYIILSLLRIFSTSLPLQRIQHDRSVIKFAKTSVDIIHRWVIESEPTKPTEPSMTNCDVCSVHSIRVVHRASAIHDMQMTQRFVAHKQHPSIATLSCMKRAHRHNRHRAYLYSFGQNMKRCYSVMMLVIWRRQMLTAIWKRWSDETGWPFVTSITVERYIVLTISVMRIVSNGHERWMAS